MNSPEHVVELIRHGHSRMNAAAEDPNTPPFIGGRQNEIQLSELGERQAPALGVIALSEGVLPNRFYSSPARRTIDTCKLSTLAMGLEVEPILDERIQELDQGAWTNQPRSLYRRPLTRVKMRVLRSRFAAPDGESIDEVGERVNDFLESLAADLDTDSPEYVWVYMHGVAIKSWVGRHEGWSHRRKVSEYIDNISRTRLVRTGDDWKVVSIGEAVPLNSAQSLLDA
jgi:broad specificity phosphatase PhoE